jgi:hypothetical protein
MNRLKDKPQIGGVPVIMRVMATIECAYVKQYNRSIRDNKVS